MLSTDLAWRSDKEIVSKTFNSPNGESKTLKVELFTWEKLDYVKKIKQNLKL